MSRASALVMSSSSAFSGSAPGWANSTMLSRMLIRVGMEVMLKVAATSGCASVSILPNTASGCFSDAFSKTGPNIRHGGHHSAQKSTRTRPPPVTVELKFSAVSSTVAIVCLLAVNTRRGIDNDARPKIPSGQRQERLLTLTPGTAAQASARNSFSSRARSAAASPRPACSSSTHWQSPLAMILNPARSRARAAAASCVSTSEHSWPSSIIRITPPIWPCARRSRRTTSASSSLSTFTAAMLYPLGYVRAGYGGGHWSRGRPDPRRTAMSLHSLLSVTIGVPNVTETAAYYADFGLTPGEDGWFSTADAGRQLRLLPAPVRRLLELKVGADDADDLARAAAGLARLGVPSEQNGTSMKATEPVTGTRVVLDVAP